jgi:hypothetical protein
MKTEKDLGSLSTPDSGTEPFNIGELKTVSIQFRTSGVVTSVALRVDASNNLNTDPPDADADWYNAAENDQTFTINTDKTGCFRLPGLAANWIRLYYVSATGGTPTIEDILVNGLSAGGR